jgi:hypothetical protein
LLPILAHHFNVVHAVNPHLQLLPYFCEVVLHLSDDVELSSFDFLLDCDPEGEDPFLNFIHFLVVEIAECEHVHHIVVNLLEQSFDRLVLRIDFLYLYVLDCMDFDARGTQREQAVACTEICDELLGMKGALDLREQCTAAAVKVVLGELDEGRTRGSRGMEHRL